MGGKNILLISLSLVCAWLAIARSSHRHKVMLGTLYATARRGPLFAGSYERSLAIAAILLGLLGLVC